MVGGLILVVGVCGLLYLVVGYLLGILLVCVLCYRYFPFSRFWEFVGDVGF